MTKYQRQIETLFVLALAGAVRLTSLNVFRAIDEEDRWAWATDFYRALLAGNLPATLVGDGYPGIFPAWLETVWLFLASLYRSLLQGRWIGDDGVFLLIHQWSRTDFLGMQRLPVALANTALVVIIFLYCRKLFGRWIALLSAIFISLDPFLLSDSRVNRAEGLLTGLMFVALLALIHSLRESERGRAANRPLLLSALFGGLAMLTKSQAVVLLPMFGVVSLLWIWRAGGPHRFVRWLSVMAIWAAAAVAVFVILWPAAWTIPADTFNLVTGFATRKVGAEGVKLFFLGRTVLDEDPGLIFYPLIFLLRATPAMLIGLLIGLWQLAIHLRLTIYDLRKNKPASLLSKTKTFLTAGLDDAGIWVLLAYALMYTAGMSLGSHKQDRFLMAAFPALNVLAAQAYVWLAARRGWSNRARWSGAAALLALSLLTALPYHPYYFSYFNPLAGGGPVASRLVRIGWGEGMDQVSAYLNQQPHPEEQVVATRFWRFMMHYPGEPINLDDDGEWVRADKIIFYIQQYQRMLDPSPGVIRYFQQHVPPEKIITINGIDYAQIYPNPIQYPAHPPDDRLNNQFRLLGYRWNDDAVTLIWENLANPPGVELRLWAAEGAQSKWQPCAPRPDFAAAAQTPGEVVESDCPLPGNLPPGLYDLQVAVRQPAGERVTLPFVAGRASVEVSPGGDARHVTPEEAFAARAQAAVPPDAAPLGHLFAGQVRLLAYQVEPAQPRPGDTLTVTTFWQAQNALTRQAHISVQAFVGNNRQVAAANGPPPLSTLDWQPGQIIRDARTLTLPADLPAPALLRLDVGLFLPDTLTPLPVTNLSGQDIPAEVARLRIPPPDQLPEVQFPQDATFGGSFKLIGADVAAAEGGAVAVTLTWQSLAPLSDDVTMFVHAVGPDGALLAQSDVLPAGGLFPVPAWQPGDVVQSRHSLALPAGTPPDSVALRVGAYRAADGARLPAINAAGEPLPENAVTISNEQ